MYTDIINADELTTRHSDYNYVINPAIKRNLETFPLKQILFNWNSLDLELKATADAEEFRMLVKQKLTYKYNLETDCPPNCYSCRD